MRQEDVWGYDTARSYDTPGTGMFAPEVLGPAVDRLAELAGDGRALEFAIGTGPARSSRRAGHWHRSILSDD